MSEDGRQVVRSPEQVALHLPLAGPTSRMLAYFVDALVVLAIEIGVGIVLFLSFPLLLRTLAEPIERAFTTGDPKGIPQNILFTIIAVALLLQLAVETLYFLLFELTTGGRSPGKWLLGLRVVRDGGFPIGLRDSLVRNLLRAVDMLPWSYTVGLAAMVISREGKRLGDLAAGTVVVRLDRPAPALPLEPVPAMDAFRFDRAEIARLGVNELTLARATLRRLDAVEPERRAELLARAAEALCVRLGRAPIEPDAREAFLRAVLEAARLR